MLEFFRGEPRQVQREILETLEANWQHYDVFVIQAPVAAGKSRCAVAISDWAASQNRSTAIITPTNVLVEQYTKEFSDLTVLHRRDAYKHPADWWAARDWFRVVRQTVSNYFVYLAHRAYKDVLIVDEAHNLLGHLTDGCVVRLWQHLYDWPDYIKTVADLLEWLETASSDLAARQEKLDDLRKTLASSHSTHLIEITQDLYRGKLRKLLKLTPLDARDAKPILWPRQVRKIVLMSATINEHDIYDLGLDQRRVLYISADSPIPPANRPVVLRGVADINYYNQSRCLEPLAAEIRNLLGRHQSNGVIHCTYRLSSQLWALLKDEPRLIWHTRQDRHKKYQEFVTSGADSGKVLVACGMYEGIDLAYDLARWQVICKVPYVNLGEPAVRERLKRRPESYAWWAVRDILQATGRVCRTPTDHGITYILDSAFNRLYSSYPKLWPKWFRQAVRG